MILSGIADMEIDVDDRVERIAVGAGVEGEPV